MDSLSNTEAPPDVTLSDIAGQSCSVRADRTTLWNADVSVLTLLPGGDGATIYLALLLFLSCTTRGRESTVRC